MQTRKLGNTELHITPIGIGAWAMGGGGWEFGWGSQDDQQSIATIKRALDMGINWIDTAAVYGLGRSEEVVGKAIKGREKPYVFTKCSMVWNEQREVSNRLKADSIRREAEGSLKRLDIDVIDLYQIHWPKPDSDIEEGWEAMAKLQCEGKVRHIGVSNFSVEQMKRIQKIAPISSLQPPYSLVHPEVERDILPYCERNNIGVISYSPMVSGLLSGHMTRERVQEFEQDDWRRNSSDFQEPDLSRNLELANLLGEIGFPHNLPAGVVAVAWTLRHPAVTGAIVGMRSIRQLEEMLPAAEFRLAESELAQIDEFLKVHV